MILFQRMLLEHNGFFEQIANEFFMFLKHVKIETTSSTFQSEM